jgi:hypothetical protein
MANNSQIYNLPEKAVIDLQKAIGQLLTPSGQVIYHTDSYTFKNSVGNRPIDWAHVKKLVASMEQQDLHKENPIIVNIKGEIVDGQHRYEARKILEKSVYYTVCQKMGASTTNTIQLLNSNSKNWKPQDYLDSFCSQGHKEYILLKKFIKEFPVFSVALAVELLGPNKSTKRGEHFKAGKFIMANEGTVRVVAKWQQEFEKLVPVKSYTSNAYFIRAVHLLVLSNKISLKAMLKALTPQVRKLTLAAGTLDAVNMLLEIFNYHKPPASRVSAADIGGGKR